MGEKMGPNTLAAFHAGADFMAAKMEEEQDSSDDEALLAGAPLESYGQARMAELRKQQERRNKPPGAVLVDPTAWRRLVVDASSDRWVLVSLDHPPNPKCEATLEALESIPISRRGGCELRRVEAKFCVPEEKLGSLPAIFGYCGGELRASVENPVGRDGESTRGHNLALENVRSRLDALYGAAARLQSPARRGTDSAQGHRHATWSPPLARQSNLDGMAVRPRAPALAPPPRCRALSLTFRAFFSLPPLPAKSRTRFARDPVRLPGCPEARAGHLQPPSLAAPCSPV